MYRIKYWDQEGSNWGLSGVMSKKEAVGLLESGKYKRGVLCPDDEYYICKNCRSSVSKICAITGDKIECLEDVCDNWEDKVD